MNTQQFVTDALQSATILRKPFPYFYAQNVFPTDVYAQMQEILQDKTDWHSEKYANRTFANAIGLSQVDFMLSPDFASTVLHLFDSNVKAAFPTESERRFRSDLRLIRDSQEYKIGPHTDAPWKVISLLFYLPETEQHSDYGTSIYVPRDPTFVCEGGPHYPFEPFERVWTAPFLPNTCLGFWKTNKSFHGVEPIPIQFRRDVLLFNIYRA